MDKLQQNYYKQNSLCPFTGNFTTIKITKIIET
jgi:hypothetical protein